MRRLTAYVAKSGTPCKQRQFVAKLQRTIEQQQILLAALAIFGHPHLAPRCLTGGVLHERHDGRIVQTQHEIAVRIALARGEPSFGHAGRFSRREHDGGRILVDVFAELQAQAFDLVGDFLRALAFVGRQRRPAVFELLDQILLEGLVDRILRLDRAHALVQRLALRHFGLERQQFLETRLRSVARRLVGRHVLQQVNRIPEIGHLHRKPVPVRENTVIFLRFDRLLGRAQFRELAVAASSDGRRVEQRYRRTRRSADRCANCCGHRHQAGRRSH